MSMSYIRRTYGVPCKRGARVQCIRKWGHPTGVVVSAKGAYIRIRFDGDRATFRVKFHPTDVKWLADDDTTRIERRRDIETVRGE